MRFVIVEYRSRRGYTFTERVAYGQVRAFMADVASVGGTVKSAHAEV